MTYEIDLKPECIAKPIRQIQTILESLEPPHNGWGITPGLMAERFYQAAICWQKGTKTQDFSMTLTLPDKRAIEMHFTA